MSDIVIENLCVNLKSNNKNILNDINLEINSKDRIGIIGESGAGKTTLISCLNLTLDKNIFKISGKIKILGKDILDMNETSREYCSKNISGIPQYSINALNPYEKIEAQLLETFLLHHQNSDKKLALEKIKEILSEIGFTNIENLLKSYPNELSGGMRQRIVIALIICTNTKIIIADEPTTALDSINQFRFIELLKKVCDAKELTLIYISHDIRIVSNICNKIAILKNGNLVEYDETRTILKAPKEEYTKTLINQLEFLE